MPSKSTVHQSVGCVCVVLYTSYFLCFPPPCGGGPLSTTSSSLPSSKKNTGNNSLYLPHSLPSLLLSTPCGRNGAKPVPRSLHANPNQALLPNFSQDIHNQLLCEALASSKYHHSSWYFHHHKPSEVEDGPLPVISRVK